MTNPASPPGGHPAAGFKVGRNQPCPCGSGKKHKSCCLGKDADRERLANERAERKAGNVITGIFDHAINRVRLYDARRGR